MKLLLAFLALVAIVQTADALPQDQTKKATIEGTVTRADNGQPIVGAQVMISKLNTAPAAGGAVVGGVVGGIVGGVAGGGGITLSSVIAAPPPVPGGTVGVTQIGPPVQIAPVTTDGEGKFVFSNLDAGTYRMNATALGFVRQEYGQRSVIAGAAPTAPFVLTDGQAMKNTAFHLTASGAVSGRIIDDAGQPAVGVPVVALQSGYDASGLKTLRQTSTGNANDRGEFRIYGLAPGRYFLAMGNGPGPLLGARGGQPTSVSYAFSYYPGVSDPAQAGVIEVKAGGEVNADMKAVRQQLRAVRGRVVDSTGMMVNNAGLLPNQSPVNVSLAYTVFNGGGSFSSGRPYDAATGKFEIQNVVPGSYTVQAQLQDTTPQGPVTSAAMLQERQAAQAARPIAEVPIVVGNADVENVVLAFTTPVTVSGRFAVEDQLLSDFPGLDRIRINFRRSTNGAPSVVGNPPQPQPSNADGTFQVVGMRSGEYIVTILGLPANYYVKRLQFDDQDFLGKPLEFAGSAGTGFQIVLSPKSGQVSGVVTDAKLQLVPGVQAVMIPEGKRNRADLYKNAVTDKDGHFTITGVTPGDYKLFAWDGLEPYRYFDPDFLMTYETKGQPVHIGESARVSADVQAIPIPQE